MVKKVPLQQTIKHATASFLVLCIYLVCFPTCELSAQDPETGSTTITNASSGIDPPLDAEQDQKKENRPRELGVMVLILWLVSGTGIGILIFVSLFGHSVRNMIGRPYPEQHIASEQPIPDENSNPSEENNEETQN